jgi:cyanophycinase
VTTLSGTPVGDAIWALYARGGVVGGTSAGAAALTELTLAGNEVDEEGKLVEQYIGPGLGLLGFKALIDTHFTQRRRLYRLFVAIADNPEIMGLGLDEDTAMVVKGEVATVVGKGGVTFVDGRSVRFDKRGRSNEGSSAHTERIASRNRRNRLHVQPQAPGAGSSAGLAGSRPVVTRTSSPHRPKRGRPEIR